MPVNGMKYIVISFLCLTVIGACDSRTGYVTPRQGIHLRSSPAFQASSLTALPYRAFVRVIQRLDETREGDLFGRWVEVDYQGRKGWIFDVYLSTEIPRPLPEFPIACTFVNELSKANGFPADASIDTCYEPDERPFHCEPGDGEHKDQICADLGYTIVFQYSHFRTMTDCKAVEPIDGLCHYEELHPY